MDEEESSVIEAERCIDGLREDVHEASSARSRLEERMVELIEGTKVTSKKAIEEYKASEAFKDEVIEGTLDIFLLGFDKC